MRYSKQKIIEQLRELGLREGDNIFVSADLMKVGYFNKNQSQTAMDWLSIFQTILGPNGTIFIPTYTDVYPRYQKKLPSVFSKDSISNSGSLANAYIKYAQNSIRSPHPVYSCIGVGPLAEKLCRHDWKTGAYDPTASSLIIKERTLCLEQLMIKTVQCRTIMHSRNLAIPSVILYVVCLKRPMLMSIVLNGMLLWMR